MKELKPSDLPLTGGVVWLYGPTGVGKTTTAIIEMLKLLSPLEKKVLYIAVERRNLRKNLEIVKKHFDWNEAELNKHLKIVQYTGSFDDLVDYVSAAKNFEGIGGVIFDSVTQTMNTDLTLELNQVAFDARTDNDKQDREIFQKSKMTQEAYGVMATCMIRLMERFEKISNRGIYVILTSLVESNPKWAKDLDQAPALKGKEFSLAFSGKCDFIGLVSRRKSKEDGSRLYPPAVTFEGDNSILTKWTGEWPMLKGEPVKPHKMPLSFERIFPEVAAATKTIEQQSN